MSELKVYHCDEWHNHYTEFYLKSEADKVIAELEKERDWLAKDRALACDDLEKRAQLNIQKDEEIRRFKQKINELQTELELWRDGSIISEAHQKELDEKRHSDYNRCLGMAKLCCEKKENCYNRALRKYTKKEADYLVSKSEFWQDWEFRWLKLAEKFKEVK